MHKIFLEKSLVICFGKNVCLFVYITHGYICSRYSNKDFQGELLHQCYDLLKQRQFHQEQPTAVTKTLSSDRTRESVVSISFHDLFIQFLLKHCLSVRYKSSVAGIMNLIATLYFVFIGFKFT